MEIEYLEKVAYNGWSVFPLVVGGKIPITEHGFKDATLDFEKIKEWFEKWPKANWGVRTGDFNEGGSGLIVIDVDRKNDGVQRWDELISERGLPDGYAVATPGGGIHHYFIFETGKEYGITASEIWGLGIDVRANGGYVVLPGSTIKGKEYEVINDSLPAILPEWISNDLDNHYKQKETRQTTEVNQSINISNTSTPYGLAALEEEVARLVATTEGNRNQQLNESAFKMGTLVGGGELDMVVAENKLTEAALQTGLPIKEIETTLQSGLKSGINQPRSAPKEDAPLPAVLEVLPEVENPPDPWKAYTLEDSFTEREPVQYVVEGVLERPSLNILYGAPGALKSLLTADMAVCVAQGKDWLHPAPWKTGAKPYKTIQTPVMFVDFDNGPRRTHDRFEALARHYKTPLDAPLFYYSLPQPWLNAGDKASIGALVNRAKEREIGLLVIDNLGLISGGVDENSPAMIPVMSLLRQLTEEIECATKVIHHERKSTGVGRIGERLRGHSSIEGSIDLALLIEREYRSESISIKSTKTRGVDVDPFSAVFTFEHDNYGNLFSAAFYGLPSDDKSSDYAIRNEIVEILEEGPLNKTNLRKGVKEKLKEVGKNRIILAIDRLVSENLIEVNSGVGKEKIYSLINKEMI